jgi:predicted exporter
MIILLLLFQRPSPIFLSILSIVWSSFTAVLATLALFGKMHILTLLFGTSLIGSCIDYSLHFFINWKGNLLCHKGYQVRNHLIKGLSLSLISTLLCYFILVFAPFNLLKQMAVFSMSGIFSSFLTVICIYPFMPVPKTKREIKLLRYYSTPSWYNKKLVGRIVVTAMFIFSLSVLVIKHKNVRIENDLSRLYKKEGREMENEAEAAAILQYNPSGWFIVSGNTVEETLQNEEKITSSLRKMNAGKEKGGFVCTTNYIPSIKRQKESRAAAANLLPLAAIYYNILIHIYKF